QTSNNDPLNCLHPSTRSSIPSSSSHKAPGPRLSPHRPFLPAHSTKMALHFHPSRAPIPPQQQPYGFDPANAQLARWAYQQTMYAQMTPPQQQGDFLAPPPRMHGAFNPFPSGTPPPRPNELQYAGHRRPSRQQSHDQQVPQVPRGQEDWRPQPSYLRSDASGSSSSVDSQGRARTNSNNSQRAPSLHESHFRVPSTKSPSPSRDAAPGGPPRIPHQSPQQQQYGGHLQQQQRWAEDDADDSDEGWGLLGGGEDDTIRVGDVGQAEEDDGEHEPWAVDVQRSVELTRVPARGVLKYAGTYNQSSYLPDVHPSHPSQATGQTRRTPPTGNRPSSGPSRAYPTPTRTTSTGCIGMGAIRARMAGTSTGWTPWTPTTGGLRKTEQRAGAAAAVVRLGAGQRNQQPAGDANGRDLRYIWRLPICARLKYGCRYTPAHNTIYAHPVLNLSAPALTSFASPAMQSPIPRAVTALAMKKVLAFASNLSVYDAFRASMYDRSSKQRCGVG
ncbi:hypothetical protein B0H16DRAFT_1852086, partial [Mycena metata]